MLLLGSRHIVSLKYFKQLQLSSKMRSPDLGAGIAALAAASLANLLITAPLLFTMLKRLSRIGDWLIDTARLSLTGLCFTKRATALLSNRRLAAVRVAPVPPVTIIPLPFVRSVPVPPPEGGGVT